MTGIFGKRKYSTNFNQMKQIAKILSICLVVFLLASSKTFSQTVYVQEQGKKYHMKNCSVAGTGKKGLSIAEAKKAGYTACKICKPDDTTPAKPKTNNPKKQNSPADKPKSTK